MSLAKRSPASQFLALPVGQGDAFYLRQGDASALIDGGRSFHGLERMLSTNAKADQLDVIVCSHNDADHALGLLGLLSAGFPCREVWLPGSWTTRMDNLLTKPAAFLAELIQNIKEIPELGGDVPEQGLLEVFGSRLVADNQYQEGEQPTERITHALEVALESDDWPIRGYPLFQIPNFEAPILIPLMMPPNPRARLLMEGVAATARIREIAVAAHANGARIRWFHFDAPVSVPPSRTDLLRGVNCGEIARIPAAHPSALFYLALSVANKESLVFQTRTVGAPGVLFTADSDLAFGGSIDWDQPLLITAPHHGSEANAHAYKRFSNEGLSCPGTKIWVRSDGRFRKRPGPSYLKTQSRFCTRCRGQDGPAQLVEFRTNRGQWAKGLMRSCVCVND